MRYENDQKCLGIYRLWCSCGIIVNDFHTTMCVLYLIIQMWCGAGIRVIEQVVRCLCLYKTNRNVKKNRKSSEIIDISCVF